MAVAYLPRYPAWVLFAPAAPPSLRLPSEYSWISSKTRSLTTTSCRWELIGELSSYLKMTFSVSKISARIFSAMSLRLGMLRAYTDAAHLIFFLHIAPSSSSTPLRISTFACMR